MKKELRNTPSDGKVNFSVAALLIALLTLTFSLNVLSQTDHKKMVTAYVENDNEVDSDKSAFDKADSEVNDSQQFKDSQDGSSELISATRYAFTAGTDVLEDMTGSTQLIGPSIDDTATALTNIGFDFWFDGVRYNQFSVNPNGLLKLGAPIASALDGRTNNFNTAAESPKIAAYWDDLCTSSTGKVHYKVVGAPGSRKLVVEWEATRTYNAGCTNGQLLTDFQIWIYESSHPTSAGAVEFVYDAIPVNPNVNGGYSVGMQSGAATNFVSVTTSTNTANYAVSNNTQVNAIPAGTNYTFTPQVPATPTGLTLTPSGYNIVLNWTDNATNELGYLIYRSLDGVGFTLLAQTAPNATSYNDAGLATTTTYYYMVIAFTEGALSSAATGNQTTTTLGTDSCTGAGGNYSNPATWADNTVPTAGDSVTIPAGCTVTVDIANADAFSMTIDAGGTLQSPTTGAVTNNGLTVYTNLTNNGTLDFSTNGDTSGAILTFGTSVADATFGGTGTNDIREIVVAKGAQTTVLDVAVSNFTVRGVNTDVAGYLTINSGTFKISSTFTLTNRTFATAAYTIPAAGGFWLNNPNYTVVAQNASGTLDGFLRMTQGTFNVGTAIDNSLTWGALTRVVIEGGAVNVAGRFGVGAAANVVNYTQSSGVVTVCTAGSTSTVAACFDLGTSASASTVAVISGGTIVIQNASTAGSGPRDYRMQSGTTGTTTITGGTVQLGNASTVGAQAFDVAGVFPNLVLTNNSGANTATFLTPVTWNNLTRNITIQTGTTMNFGNFVFLFNGTTLTNNGTITHNGASSNFVFFTTGAAVLYTGTGVVTAPLNALAFQTDAGTTFDAASPGITALAVRLFIGNVINANKITVGNGGTTTATVQIGNTTTPLAAGTFDTTMNFNPGTGGTSILYLRTTTSRTTGGEIPASRTITALTLDNNLAGYTLTLAGGNLTVTGAMTLTNGILVTNAANTLIHNGAATRTAACPITTCYVDGPLARVVTVASYTFHVGENGYSPVLVATTATTAGSTLTAEAFDATLAGMNPPTSASRNWALTESGDITANLSFTYLEADTPDTGINTDEDDYRVWRREGTGATQTFTNMCPMAPCVNTTTNVAGPVTGVTQFSRWTVANAQVPVASNVQIAGRVVNFDGVSGMSNAKVTLSGGGLLRPVTINTNPFGYYSFDELPAGRTYILQVGKKGYFFSPPSIVVSPVENISNADFIAQPQ